MKAESEFNTMMKNSIIEAGGFAHKISDVGQIQHGVLPFDLFGCCDNRMIVCESKFMSNLQAFNFHHLEDHQMDNLIKVYETFKDSDRVCSMFAIGVVFGRGDIRVFWWANESLYNIRERKLKNNNIYKKEFEKLDNYLSVRKGLIDFKEILNEL